MHVITKVIGLGRHGQEAEFTGGRVGGEGEWYSKSEEPIDELQRAGNSKARTDLEGSFEDEAWGSSRAQVVISFLHVACLLSFVSCVLCSDFSNKRQRAGFCSQNLACPGSRLVGWWVCRPDCLPNRVTAHWPTFGQLVGAARKKCTLRALQFPHAEERVPRILGFSFHTS